MLVAIAVAPGVDQSQVTAKRKGADEVCVLD